MVPTLIFGKDILNRIETGITKEWIETNGLGSYAMGTIVGANTRRVHALFATTSDFKLKRTILANRVEESFLIRGVRIDASCQEYPGNISPQGHLHLESFTFDPFPRWIYSINDLKIEKSFFVRSGEETSVLIYKHLLGPSIKLILRPFFSCRDEHTLIQEGQQFENAIQVEGNRIRCSAANAPEFFTTVISDPSSLTETIKIYKDGYWYKNLVYAQEEEMGLDYQEDLFSPGQAIAELSPYQQVALVFSDQPKQNIELNHWIKEEIFIRSKILENFSMQGPFAKRCAIAADQFVIRDRNKEEFKIILGYPWREDTIRESLMSLPGICLATGQINEARSILNHCRNLIHEGLLPRCFSHSGTAEYSNMDASLWFIWAVQKYWGTTKDLDFLNEMKPVVEKIVESFRKGIKITTPTVQCETFMDSDCLIWGGSNRFPLTWMNGKVDTWISTPRRGKPVEVQALWYNALQFCSEIFLKFGETDHGWIELAKKVRENFNTLFWNMQMNYLYDVIDENSREGSIRPNALYAISMPYEILEPEKFRPLLETAWKTLYSSLGLRTLASQEPHYHGTLTGDQKNRVSAVHNGTISSFLIGPFLTAFFKTFGRDQKNKEEAIHFLRPFAAHLSDSGLGTISEMFDGDSPHNPRGAVADSRAIAEILRVMKEEGLEL